MDLFIPGESRDRRGVVDCVRTVVRVDLVVIFDCHRDLLEVKVTGIAGEPSNVWSQPRLPFHMPQEPPLDTEVMRAYLVRMLQEYSEPF